LAHGLPLHDHVSPTNVSPKPVSPTNVSPEHLLLTGYRGCGKSTIGSLLAAGLSRNFVDTDLEIESKAGKSIAEIFSESGEAGFRDLESWQIANLISLPAPSVIALGGGAIIRPENRLGIRALGKTVWLQASSATILHRIASDESTQSRRPKLSKLGHSDEIETILSTRIPWYKEVSDFVISTDESPMEHVVQSILEWYQSQA